MLIQNSPASALASLQTARSAAETAGSADALCSYSIDDTAAKTQSGECNTVRLPPMLEYDVQIAD